MVIIPLSTKGDWHRGIVFITPIIMCLHTDCDFPLPLDPAVSSQGRLCRGDFLPIERPLHHPWHIPYSGHENGRSVRCRSAWRPAPVTSMSLVLMEGIPRCSPFPFIHCLAISTGVCISPAQHATSPEYVPAMSMTYWTILGPHSPKAETLIWDCNVLRHASPLVYSSAAKLTHCSSVPF